MDEWMDECSRWPFARFCFTFFFFFFFLVRLIYMEIVRGGFVVVYGKQTSDCGPSFRQVSFGPLTSDNSPLAGGTGQQRTCVCVLRLRAVCGHACM